MKKLIALLVAAGIVGYPAATWYFGRRAQTQSAQLDSQLNATFPYVTVVSSDYQKGFFKSTHTLKLRPAFPGFDAKPEHEFSLVNEIEHGPLPGFKGIGAARINHVLLVPAALQKALASVYGEQAPLTAVTQINIGGGGTTTLSSPKISGQAADRNFSFQGLDGVVKFASGYRSFDYKLSAPGLELSDNKDGKLNVGAIAMTGAQTKVEGTEHIYVGKQDSSVAAISLVSAGKPAFSMQGLRYVVENSNAEKNFISVSGKLNGTSLKAGELDLGALDYEFSMQKLHAPSLDALTKAIQATVAKNTEASAAKLGAANPTQSAMGMNADMLTALKQHLPELSKHQPSFTLDKLRVGTDKDFALTNATLRLLPVAATDLDNPTALIPKLDAALNIELSDSFLALLSGAAASRMGAASEAASASQLPPELRASAEALQAQQALQVKQMVDAQLEGAIAQGFLIRGVGKVSAQLTLRAGQLLVNGRPMGPNLGQMK